MSIKRKDYVKASVHVQVTPGEALRIMRESQEMSQNKLAELSGISQSNISALENGAKQMGRVSAMQLAKALQVHPAVLLFPDYDEQSAA